MSVRSASDTYGRPRVLRRNRHRTPIRTTGTADAMVLMDRTRPRARRAGEPTPDLTDYVVVHRAMVVDLDRLATAAAQLVDRPDPARHAALRQHLKVVSYELENHHQVEDDSLWPFLVELDAERAALVRLTDDHEQLDPLLHRAAELAALRSTTSELAAALRKISDLLTRHIADEENEIFPFITTSVTVDDYQRLQVEFRRNLKPSMLSFLVPWVLDHAAADERARMLAESPLPLRVMYRVFAPRFRARQRLLFGAT